MTARPLLGGAFLGVGMRLLTDRTGARRTGLALTAVPLLLGCLWAP